MGMFREPQLKPGQKLTPIQHPKQSIGQVSDQVRILMMMAVLLAAGGVLYLLKEQGAQQQTELTQVRGQRNAELVKAIPAANKGESKNASQRALVQKVGQALAQKSDAKNSSVKWKFHLLAEENAINLYALSNGEVYVTTALVNRMKTEGALAAALAHGVAHALAFDMPEALPNAPANAPQWAYALESESTADVLALKLMAQAGYDPNAMIGMFTVLAEGYNKGADVGFFSTHPNDRERMSSIQAAITRMYPNGVPAVLSK